MKAMGITEEQLVISDDIIRVIIDNYTMESGVRGLRKRLDTLCRLAAVEVSKKLGAAAVSAAKASAASAAKAAAEAGAGEASGQIPAQAPAQLQGPEPIVVKEENLREMLDAKPIRHDHVLAEKKPGIVTGLAWTAAGGEILFIETLFTKGSGKFTVTGQLGDVMKESVQIAVSLVKSMFPDRASLFEENDLHIHVPEGAVPKDGPSAGITMTTALASLVSGKMVAPTMAMTGEVSLRGVVTPIGGLPEKLMAASRAGIQTVFIPKENEDDLDEVPEEVKEKLTIVPVGDVKEVLEKTGIL